MLIPVNLEELLILNLYNQGLCIIINLPLSNTALETTSWMKAHEMILKWKKKYKILRIFSGYHETINYFDFLFLIKVNTTLNI